MVNWKANGYVVAGEPYASQHTILYNSEKKPNFVGCKIRSMLSRLVFLSTSNAGGPRSKKSSKFQMGKQISIINEMSV